MPQRLVVGPLKDVELRNAAQDWLVQRLGRAAPAVDAWNADIADEVIPIPDFGLVMKLRDHVSMLEGIEGIEEALERTRFPDIPAYPWHLWLPVDFAPPKFPLIAVKIGPRHLASAVRMKAQLDEVLVLGAKKRAQPAPPVVETIALLQTAAEKAIARKTVLRGFAG